MDPKHNNMNNKVYPKHLHLGGKCLDTCVCVYVLFALLHIEYQNLHFTIKVRTFLRREEILADPHNIKGLIWF